MFPVVIFRFDLAHLSHIMQRGRGTGDEDANHRAGNAKAYPTSDNPRLSAKFPGLRCLEQGFRRTKCGFKPEKRLFVVYRCMAVADLAWSDPMPLT